MNLTGKVNAFVCMLMVSFCAFGNNPSFHVPHIAETIEVDGKLNEPHWQQATKVSLDYVTRPYENTTPPVKTQAFLYEDGQTLYVAFKAFDSNPEAIRAFYRDRDKTWGQDVIGIKIDTFNTSRLAYQFFVNPFGIQSDSIQNELTGSESDSWDPIWYSKGEINSDGYTVEMAIPLRVLSFNETTGEQKWRMELVRFYPREDTLRIANRMIDRNNTCDLCQMVEVSGFGNAKQGKSLAVVPTLVLAKGRVRNLPAENWQYNDNQEVGLDVNWGISPEVSLQATVNPDFSQVESDVAQLNINNTFSLFFDEKRPFFVENADYFSTNYNLVYTRNIGSPDYGTKVTGRMDKHTFGVFVANDEKTTFLVPGNLGSSIASFDKKSTNMALRYRYDWSSDLSLGFITTARRADDYHNYVVGLDGKYQPTNHDTFKMQVLRSQTQNPADLYQSFCNNDCTRPADYSEAALRTQRSDDYADVGYRFNYNHNRRNWFLRATHINNGKDLRADLGFVSKADWQFNVVGAGYRWYNADDSGWWNKIQIDGDWDITHNEQGELLEKEVEAKIVLEGAYQSILDIGSLRRQRVGNRQLNNELSLASSDRFDEQQSWIYTEARPLPELIYRISLRSGDQIDFANNRLGKQLYFSPQVELSMGQHMQLNVKHTYSDLDVDNKALFTANLTDLRLTYQFDQRQLLRLILIYSNIKRNPDNYLFRQVDAMSRNLGTQLLYSYKINPLTKFFVGYSSGAVEDKVAGRLKDDNQSFFLKFSYAWLG